MLIEAAVLTVATTTTTQNEEQQQEEIILRFIYKFIYIDISKQTHLE